MKNKKTIVMSTLLLVIVLLGIGTIAYFRRTVNGDITGQAGNLVLIVNEANAVDNETFTITLQRSEEEQFIMPDDSGVFNLNIDSSGSSSDVAISIAISRINLPENLKFYSDEKHTNEITNYGTVIKKSNDMTRTVPIYWFWDGSINDEDDSEFINQTISANISVSASITKTLRDTLLTQNVMLDTNVDFSLEAEEVINQEDAYNESKECNEYLNQCYENGDYCEEFLQQCFKGNGHGLMMRDGTQNDEYPILYYRGNIGNNNVVYAGYCWLIVRTTETGGTKLIYNGEVNDDGSCNNYSGVNNVEIKSDDMGAFINQGAVFNIDYNSPVYVGYMYNDTNTYFTGNSGGVLDVNAYIAHLEDNTIDAETGHHTQNLKDSVIKELVDDWYEVNLKGKAEESLLEDTVWCNDRSVISENFSIQNYDTTTKFYFAAQTRLRENKDTTGIKPSLVCARDMDKFTVDESNGNGDLEYPIGLLTADEIVMSGNTPYTGYYPYVEIDVITYLSSIGCSSSLSPFEFDYGQAGIYSLCFGELWFGGVDVGGILIRPAVSLSVNTVVVGGTGMFDNPYIVA